MNFTHLMPTRSRWLAGSRPARQGWHRAREVPATGIPGSRERKRNGTIVSFLVHALILLFFVWQASAPHTDPNPQTAEPRRRRAGAGRWGGRRESGDRRRPLCPGRPAAKADRTADHAARHRAAQGARACPAADRDAEARAAAGRGADPIADRRPRRWNRQRRDQRGMDRAPVAASGPASAPATGRPWVPEPAAAISSFTRRR